MFYHSLYIFVILVWKCQSESICQSENICQSESICPWFPLCCPKTEAFNGSHCVQFEEVSPEALPVFYEEAGNESLIEFKHFPLLNCLSMSFTNVSKTGSDEWRISVLENGSVSLRPKNRNQLVADVTTPCNFCVMRKTSEDYQLRVCESMNEVASSQTSVKNQYIDCARSICVSKCCLPGSYVSLTSKAFGCQPNEHDTPEFLPMFKYANGTGLQTDRNISFVVHFPLCKLYEFESLNLLQNGSLYLPTTGETLPRDKYCLDAIHLKGNTSIRGSVCSETLTFSFAEKISRMIHPIGLLVSCIFLGVTFICHVIIPKLRDLQGCCFMCYVGALFFAFLFLCINILIPSIFSRYGCVGLAILTYFSLLAAFFWLNVMCFDIWKVIRGTVHVVELKNIQGNKKKTFILYSVYAWGLPIVVSLVALVFHLLPEDSVSSSVIRPQFRKSKCWFSNDIKVLFTYFNGIIAVLFFVNIVFIIHTSVMLFRAGVAFSCCRTKKRTIGESEEIKGNNRLLLNMFWHRFCLFALMAINWTTEVLSLIPPTEMWILTDVLNTLQGLFIFILFLRSTNKRLMLVEAWRNIVRMTRKKTNPLHFRRNEVNARFIAKGPKGDEVHLTHGNIDHRKI